MATPAAPVRTHGAGGTVVDRSPERRLHPVQQLAAGGFAGTTAIPTVMSHA